MSEELKSVESEGEGIVEQDSSEGLVDVSLDQILEYAYDEGIEADKVDAWIAENFITEQDDEEEEDEDEEEEVPAESKKASLKKEQDEESNI